MKLLLVCRGKQSVVLSLSWGKPFVSLMFTSSYCVCGSPWTQPVNWSWLRKQQVVWWMGLTGGFGIWKCALFSCCSFQFHPFNCFAGAWQFPEILLPQRCHQQRWLREDPSNKTAKATGKTFSRSPHFGNCWAPWSGRSQTCSAGAVSTKVSVHQWKSLADKVTELVGWQDVVKQLADLSYVCSRKDSSLLPLE